MTTHEQTAEREEQWLHWASSTLGGDQARCRAAARAAVAAQQAGGGFEAAAAEARRAHAAGDGGGTDAKPLVSPDGKWTWDGDVWVAVEQSVRGTTVNPPAPAPAAQNGGVSSWFGLSTSEDMFYGQNVIVWARWILIATGLVLSFWDPKDLGVLQIQLAAIIALAFGNFYLHVQLLRGHPAIDRVVYGASVADLAVVTTLVLAQGGFMSPVFVFYFAAVLGFSVAFPMVLTAMYTAGVVVVYGSICVATTDPSDYPAVFTRLLMIAAIAVCGSLFARSESHRRVDAVRLHEESSSDIELPAGAGDREPLPADVA